MCKVGDKVKLVKVRFDRTNGNGHYLSNFVSNVFTIIEIDYSISQMPIKVKIRDDIFWLYEEEFEIFRRENQYQF